MVYKVVEVILNFWFAAYINFHNVLHGLWAGSGTGNRLPRGQTDSAVSVHEGGVPVRNISGPEQGVWRLGQGQMPGYPGGVWSGTSGPPYPSRVLGQTTDGSLHGGVLQGIV